VVVVPAAGARSGFDGRALDRQLRSEPGLLGVLVERDGRVLFERYYNGSSVRARLDVFSITKAVTATLVGIALGDGRLHSLDQRLGDFFPRYVRAANDPRVRRITLRQLLTLTSGYRDVLTLRSDDWLQTYIDRDLAEPPGRTWSYDNGSYHLLSAVLTKVTGLTADAYARRVLFGPLGIRGEHWTSDGQGRSLGNTGLRLAARDLLRFGELYLHGGRVDGRQMVAAGYARDATSPHVRFATVAYGYGFWIFDRRRPHGFAAFGAEGQAVAIFPSLHAVVVVQGSGEQREHVLFDVIVPHLR
jgi:CubicO group peptidase (beta-lactamase class C family)